MNSRKHTGAFDPVPVRRPEVRHLFPSRTYQGVPGIAEAPSGRLFAVWMSGGGNHPDAPSDGFFECRDNYILLAVSDNQGESWSDAVAVVDPPGEVRAFDANVWCTPDGELWLFWSQSLGGEPGKLEIFDGCGGVWFSRLLNCDAAPEDFQWSAPQRISDGIMLNKPVVFQDEWFFPAAIWPESFTPGGKRRKQRGEVLVVVSPDQGNSFALRAVIPLPDEGGWEPVFFITAKEHLRCVIRSTGKCVFADSHDHGRTWSEFALFPLENPNSRFLLLRTVSGALLGITSGKGEPLANAPGWFRRKGLLAAFSHDDGETWSEPLLLDERDDAAYPDGFIARDGAVRIIYDCQRRKRGEISTLSFREPELFPSETTSSFPENRRTIVSCTGNKTV